MFVCPQFVQWEMCANNQSKSRFSPCLHLAIKHCHSESLEMVNTAFNMVKYRSRYRSKNTSKPKETLCNYSLRNNSPNKTKKESIEWAHENGFYTFIWLRLFVPISFLFIMRWELTFHITPHLENIFRLRCSSNSTISI